MDSPAHENPGDLHGYCGGPDVVLTDCSCPDPVLSTAIHIRSGAPVPVKFKLWCLCCRLPIDVKISFGRSTA